MDGASAESLLALVEEARARMAGADASAQETIEARYSDVLDAMDWCLEYSRADEAHRFATALVPFWMATKRIDDGDAWFARAIESAAGSEARRARAVYDHGYLVFWAGRYELADARFTEARALAKAIGDRDLEALALAGAARVALNDDLDEAVRLLREAVRITEDLPDSRGRSSAMHVLGPALQMSGDLQGAREVMTARLERGRAEGNASLVFSEAGNLSMVERKLGNLEHANELSLEALRAAIDVRHELAIAWMINGLAAVTAARGDLERAATLLGLAGSLLERAGGEWPGDEREQYEETLATLRAGLDAAALDARLTAGTAMSLDDGTAYALGD